VIEEKELLEGALVAVTPEFIPGTIKGNYYIVIEKKNGVTVAVRPVGDTLSGSHRIGFRVRFECEEDAYPTPTEVHAHIASTYRTGITSSGSRHVSITMFHPTPFSEGEDGSLEVKEEALKLFRDLMEFTGVRAPLENACKYFTGEISPS